jgi:hypothetical protein
MDVVLWVIIGILTVTTGIGAISALIAMSTSRYRG